MGSLGDAGAKEMLPKASDPVTFELNRLMNQLRDKDRELGLAQSEIKALRGTELMKDKAICELSNEVTKLDEKLRTAEEYLEYKNLEVKKTIDEKKGALAAQFAAEATLRRVHATQKDEESISIDSLIAPLESEIKMCKTEIATLQEDKKVLERLTKSKEAALLEAERILQEALERALMVETVQNQNLDLKKQIGIYQEENKLLEKTNRQKVLEVEKLTETIHELEEAILAGGAAANAVRDYQRRVSELNEEKKTLERELARVKVSANRVAAVVANEWKDESDKVMPVKQWLEERRLLQGEIQRLREKVTISERTAKAEAQLKDKLKLRLKTLEEGLKQVTSLSSKQDENFNQAFGYPTRNAGSKVRSSSQPRASFATSKVPVLQQPNCASGGVDSTRSMKRTASLKSRFIGENLARKNLWAPRFKFFDDNGKENTETKVSSNTQAIDSSPRRTEVSEELRANTCHDVESPGKGHVEDGSEDIVSGFLYDRLQKDVINLRKLYEEKERMLNAKDDETKLLLRKIDTLTKAMEVESKKMRREAAVREKEVAVKLEDIKQNGKTSRLLKRAVKHHEPSANSKKLNTVVPSAPCPLPKLCTVGKESKELRPMEKGYICLCKIWEAH